MNNYNTAILFPRFPLDSLIVYKQYTRPFHLFTRLPCGASPQKTYFSRKENILQYYKIVIISNKSILETCYIYHHICENELSPHFNITFKLKCDSFLVSILILNACSLICVIERLVLLF